MATPKITSFARSVVQLGPWSGRYTPSYDVKWYKEGNPRREIKGFDTKSIVSIETSKNIANISGAWRIVLKDAKAEHAVAPMDVVIIRLKGHNQPLTSVLHGVVDNVEKEGAAEPESAQENTVIEGRCLGKYLQINSLFLPVWEPKSLLPTALTFGLGAPGGQVGVPDLKSVTTPREIFGYIYRTYIVGLGKQVGLSGTPAARHWLNKEGTSKGGRFEDIKVTGGSGGIYRVPYIQFDENTCDQVLTSLTITGFTEAWIDEFGYVVYRPPGWDKPVSYVLYTDGLVSEQLGGTDVGMATYVEVVPTGLNLESAQSQATMAGRAPVPSSYITHNKGEGDEGSAYVSKEVTIETDKAGKVTKAGEKNYWYRKQKKYGLRPYPVTSPLLMQHNQAQVQAEGLLKFLGNRLQKTGTVVIPGEPGIRLGTTILIRGELRGKKIERTFFVEGVSHEYIDGQAYKTTLELTHGRDPWDPEWKNMVFPATLSGSALLAEFGGVAKKEAETESATAIEGADSIPGEKAKVLSSGEAVVPAEAPAAIQQMIAGGNAIRSKPYVYGGGHGGTLEMVSESYDCSSSVSFILYHGGLISSTPQTSGELESFGEAGPGKYVTIYANAEHVWMVVAGISWDHGEGHWYPGTLGDGHETLSAFVVRHPNGL